LEQSMKKYITTCPQSFGFGFRLGLYQSPFGLAFW